MDRRSRPPFARRRIAGALALALALGGCGSNPYVRYSSTSPAAGPPGGTTGYVSGSTSSASVAAVAIFLLNWSLLNQYWDSEAGMYGSSTLPAPPMDEARSVHTQDCTRPIENWSANLRCR
ncbi:MAG: hypothetical protein IT513_07875 [Burkholderiales bacterium]|nr:hypothetical protein [Burkholderiales bacterium]